jgi:hypothetical protein
VAVIADPECRLATDIKPLEMWSDRWEEGMANAALLSAAPTLAAENATLREQVRVLRETLDAERAETARQRIPANRMRHPPGCPDADWCRGNGVCYWDCAETRHDPADDIAAAPAREAER